MASAAGRSGAAGIGAASPAKAAASVALALVDIPGGLARIGTDAPDLPGDGEGPERSVRLRPFRMMAHAVSNAEFAAFSSASGYRTDAERLGWSFVFHTAAPAASRDRGHVPEAMWWRRVDGACWSSPEGPGSNLAERMDHPVVHVSWTDAAAFAAWAGGRLPTEAEWEWAAKGGIPAARFPWGDREPDDDFLPCNIWQGSFPDHDAGRDGYRGTCPVTAFEANGFGLRNMSGNTWEWCADAFRIRSLSRGAAQRNATMLKAGERVMKGGSYLCHRSYCYRYRIAARTGSPRDSSTAHLGFRICADF